MLDFQPQEPHMWWLAHIILTLNTLEAERDQSLAKLKQMPGKSVIDKLKAVDEHIKMRALQDCLMDLLCHATMLILKERKATK